jgi:hypothetical protein
MLMATCEKKFELVVIQLVQMGSKGGWKRIPGRLVDLVLDP